MSNEYSLEYTKKIMANVIEILAQNGSNRSRLASQIGLSRSTIHRYVKGERALSVYRLKEIADALGVSASSLLPRQDSWKGGKS